MLSTLLELAGLAALVAGVFILTSLGWALIVSCPVLLFVGYSARDTPIPVGRAIARLRAVRRK